MIIFKNGVLFNVLGLFKTEMAKDSLFWATGILPLYSKWLPGNNVGKDAGRVEVAVHYRIGWLLTISLLGTLGDYILYLIQGVVDRLHSIRVEEGACTDETFTSVVGFITQAPVIRQILDHVGRCFELLKLPGRTPQLYNDFAHDPFLDYGPQQEDRRPDDAGPCPKVWRSSCARRSTSFRDWQWGFFLGNGGPERTARVFSLTQDLNPVPENQLPEGLYCPPFRGERTKEIPILNGNGSERSHIQFLKGGRTASFGL